MKKRVLLTVLVIAATVMGAVFCGERPRLRAEEPPAEAETLSDSEIVMYIGSVNAYVNGSETSIIPGESAAPYLSGGRTFVPLRFVADALGAETQWNPETREAAVISGGRRIFVADAQMRDGRLYVPLRFVAENLGMQVFYERGLIVVSENALSYESDKSAVEKLTARFTGLERVGSKERLIELLDLREPQFEAYDMENGMAFDEGAVSGSGAAPAAAPLAPEAARQSAETAAESAPAGDTGYSKTNVQVEGIDEADIIKTDGEYIYYSRGGKIEIVRAHPDGKLELMSEISSDSEFGEIFIDENKIVAVGGEYGGYIEVAPLARSAAATSRPGYPYTRAVVYDTTDKKNPKEERSVELKGNFVSARKTGKSVYLISANYVSYYNIEEAAPSLRDSAAGGGETEIGWERVYCFPIVRTNSITSIAGFNIDEPDKPVNIETFVGAGENIYMSENALYIANSEYGEGSNKTDIYKFAASNGEIVYQAKGSIPGTLINQFAMDEFGGYFRAGTTVYSYDRRTQSQSNSLYVLDGSMETVGKIEGIAPQERIYSVRFMGNRAYMVTFKQVDPLFAIDVSDPREPKIMGKLKIPGYSDYLHPYDENHLIGFGKDTTTDKYGNAFYLGMKLSMFDITDMSDPKEMFTEYIGDRGTDSLLLQNHKALLFDKERGLMAFPVTLFEAGGRGDELEYGEFAGSYAYVYDVDLKNGFTLRGRVSHLTESDLQKASSWGGDTEKYIERILTIGRRFYVASQKIITSNDFNALSETGRVEFK